MSSADLWSRILEAATERFPPVAVEQWIAPLHPAGEEDGRLLLVGPQWVVWFATKRYAPWLGEKVREFSGLSGVRIREETS